MKVFDTNMILRYLVNDDEVKAEQVEKLLKTEHALIFPEVIAEVVYVTRNFYQCDREVSARIISDFIGLEEVTCEHEEALRYALQLYGETTLDFVDCLLAAIHAVEGHEICTFDKKLNKLIAKIDAG